MGQYQDVIDRRKAAEDAFVVRYRKGLDYMEKGATHKTFGIDVSYFDVHKWSSWKECDPESWHGNKIAVYGDEALRDKILESLQNS